MGRSLDALLSMGHPSLITLSLFLLIFSCLIASLTGGTWSHTEESMQLPFISTRDSTTSLTFGLLEYETTVYGHTYTQSYSKAQQQWQGDASNSIFRLRLAGLLIIFVLLVAIASLLYAATIITLIQFEMIPKARDRIWSHYACMAMFACMITAFIIWLGVGWSASRQLSSINKQSTGVVSMTHRFGWCLILLGVNLVLALVVNITMHVALSRVEDEMGEEEESFLWRSQVGSARYDTIPTSHIHTSYASRSTRPHNGHTSINVEKEDSATQTYQQTS